MGRERPSGGGELTRADLPLTVDEAHPRTTRHTGVDPRNDTECPIASAHFASNRIGDDSLAQGLDDRRIEGGPRACVDDRPAGSRWLGGLVGALAGYGVVDIGYGSDPRELMDPPSGELLRVTRPVPALVVFADHRSHDR